MSAESTEAGRLALDERWPSLFDDLPAADRYLITQTVAAGWHEGWTPDREDVRCLGRTAKVFLMHVAELSRYRLRFDLVEPDCWNLASTYTLPDRQSTTPVPALMVPVFTEISELRDRS